jgi:hypothetical protein
VSRNALALFLLTVALATPAAAEIYTWTDAQGQIHMVDDLSKVPRAYRERAAGNSREAVEKPARMNELDLAPTVDHSPPASAAPGAAPVVHVLQVERAGREMVLWAELDGGVRVPFVADTGAMGCTIPRWAVTEMGIEFDRDTPMTAVRGISGKPMLVPVITVGSTRVGDAEVEDLEMAVLDTQQMGLLGMTFFNHFRVRTDPAGGTLTLEEIDLDAIEGVYGGLGEKAWRNKFAYVNSMLENIRKVREQFPDEYTDYESKLAEIEVYWELQLDELELKASRAGVPRPWRE